MMREWIRRFVARRFDASTFLGLHLTVTLIVAAGAAWLFASLFDAVLDNATLVRFDQFADRAIHAQNTPAGLAFFSNMSRIGSPAAMTAVAVAGAIYLFTRRWRTLLITWIAAFAGAAVIENVLKVVVHRRRPPYGTAYLSRITFSFPSGHATLSMVGAVMAVHLVFVAWRPGAAGRAAAVCVAAVFVLLVGASRVYLGVHFPSDVLGGWAVGAGWAAICLAVAGVVLHRRGLSLSF